LWILRCRTTASAKSGTLHRLKLPRPRNRSPRRASACRPPCPTRCAHASPPSHPPQRGWSGSRSGKPCQQEGDGGVTVRDMSAPAPALIAQGPYLLRGMPVLPSTRDFLTSAGFGGAAALLAALVVAGVAALAARSQAVFVCLLAFRSWPAARFVQGHGLRFASGTRLATFPCGSHSSPAKTWRPDPALRGPDAGQNLARQKANRTGGHADACPFTQKGPVMTDTAPAPHRRRRRQPAHRHPGTPRPAHPDA
jgi:hypothetical protein